MTGRTDGLNEAAPKRPVLEATNLMMEFGGFRVIDGVNLSIAEGSVHALIGPNGAGKTTCFNIITKFLKPTKGRVLFQGEDVTGLPPVRLARLGLVRSFQISASFPELSVIQNVCIALQSRYGRVYRMLQSERSLSDLRREAEDYLEQVGLQEFRHVRAATLPYGRKRALELATTLALDPKVMLLDEPMAGMSPADVEMVKHLILRIAKGRTILMVEHNLPVVAELSDRITVLARGKVIAEGDYESVSSNGEVRAAYIGVEDG